MPDAVAVSISHESPPARKFVFRVPPKSSAVVAPDGSRGGVRIAMWEIWLDLAKRHAAFADECRLPRPDLEADGSDDDDPTRCGNGEIEHSMLAIGSAAFAIDGLYGSVRPYVEVALSKAARPRRIFETLKHGFTIGKVADRWRVELDWLFDVRDGVVHHADDYQPLQVVHETDDLLVAVPVGLQELGADSAARAAAFADEVIATCRSSPKPATQQWVLGKANWDEGPGETLYPGDLAARLFPLLRDA